MHLANPEEGRKEDLKVVIASRAYRRSGTVVLVNCGENRGHCQEHLLMLPTNSNSHSVRDSCILEPVGVGLHVATFVRFLSKVAPQAGCQLMLASKTAILFTKIK